MADEANNVKQAYAMLNGQKLIAKYDASTDLYTVEGSAPSESSWNQPGHVYAITLYAEDLAGNVAIMDSTDSTYGSQLKLRVLEKTKPTASITYPTEGSVLGSSNQTISLSISDSGGSGINLDSVVFKLNGALSLLPEWVGETGGGYTTSYSATNLSDGVNTAELLVYDNDGNASNTAKVSFIISTVAPTLSVDSPIEGLITNEPTVTVSGVATAGTANVTLTEVTVNGESISFDSAGAYTTTFVLSEGLNTIIITAKDNIGKATTVIRRVTLDTSVPVISDVVAVATTVDASGMIKITFKVTDK